MLSASERISFNAVSHRIRTSWPYFCLIKYETDNKSKFFVITQTGYCKYNKNPLTSEADFLSEPSSLMLSKVSIKAMYIFNITLRADLCDIHLVVDTLLSLRICFPGYNSLCFCSYIELATWYEIIESFNITKKVNSVQRFWNSNHDNQI